MSNTLTIHLNDELELKVDTYRRGVKASTGRTINRTTAATQLLEKALAGIEPEEAVTYANLTARVKRLEDKVFG